MRKRSLMSVATKSNRVALFVIASSLLLSGCATILNDDFQQINISSSGGQPIKGTIDGVPFSGPGIVPVKRAKNDKIITVETSTCTKQTLLKSDVDTKFFINILSGGVFGSSTDFLSEKMWKYQDNVVVQCN